MTEPGVVRAGCSGPAPPDAPDRRPGPEPASRAGAAGRPGSTYPGLVGIRYLVAVALLVALVWVPALIMIVAAHRSLPP